MATRNTENPNAKDKMPSTSEEMPDSVKIGGDVKISGDSRAPTIIGNNNTYNNYYQTPPNEKPPQPEKQVSPSKSIKRKIEKKSSAAVYYAVGTLLIIGVVALVLTPNLGKAAEWMSGSGGNGNPSTENTQFPPVPPANPPSDPMPMLDIPGGTFNMGSAFIPDSSPVSEVTISAFQMDKTEVTNEMYAVCVQAGSCEPPKDTTYFNDSTYAHHPVVYVTWHDAKAYCEWLGKRLPSEAEWEKAARDTDERIYPWGNDAPNTHLLNYKNQGTSPVGNYPAGKSPYGILDMAGNVWEWTASLNENYPYKTGESREDPNNPGERVIRGGSWKDEAGAVHSAVRYWYSPNIYLNNLGFRCVK